MRNKAYSSNTLIRCALEDLERRLPKGWTVKPVPTPGGTSDFGVDGAFAIRGPDGRKITVVVDAKSRLTAQAASAVTDRLTQLPVRPQVEPLLVTSYLSPLARQRLSSNGISYLDLTGNVRISFSEPALYIETQGAAKDPSPPARGVASLKGGKAARLIRALCDWRPPVGVRALAKRAGTDPGYASRVLSLLTDEDVLRRSESGEVTEVFVRDLIDRWTEDYRVTETNRTVSFLAPRGPEGFYNKLRAFSDRYALTGAAAIPNSVRVSSTPLISCYVDFPENAATALDLRPAESGANVFLIEPFDSVIWERPTEADGLTRVGLSQLAADLLTGTGREPADGEALLAWMEASKGDWCA